MRRRVGFERSVRKALKLVKVRSAELLRSDRFSYPALHRIDRRLVELLPRGPGTYLEVGANDGYAQSNTYFLARRGWTGILIEPSPFLFRWCQRFRPESTCVRAACVAHPAPGGTVRLAEIDLMSVVVGIQSETEEAARLQAGPVTGSYEVPARRLSDVIAEAGFGSVDLMSIDVEGAELELLGGLDLTRHCPGWLIVETAVVDQVDVALAGWMTRVEALSHHDYLYRRDGSTHV